MAKSFLVVVSLILAISARAQSAAPDSRYRLLHSTSFVQTKNYYLLTLFDALKEVKALLSKDETLAAIGRTKVDSLNTALKNCDRDGLCFINRMKFSETEIKAVSERLAALYTPVNALGKLVQAHLIPSGAYVLFQTLPAREMLVKAWEQDAAGVNYALDVYAGGKKPNYPLIDSISFNTKDPRNNNTYLYNYVSLLYNTASLVAAENKKSPTFYSPSLTAALHFIEMNEREQAADYEPMELGENKAAVGKIKVTNWKAYKYSVILLPGAGPEEPGVALSAEGMLRCRLAAIQYGKGVAPFIIPSGGKVHPYKTKYCEAVEMKKYLVEKLGVPASAVIIEPHARHTTTNMRNAARLMYRYGIPFTMPGITCTTRGQSTMIGMTLIARCQKELGEVPYKNGQRLSETEIEFYPLIEALHINPNEPIDP